MPDIHKKGVRNLIYYFDAILAPKGSRRAFNGSSAFLIPLPHLAKGDLRGFTSFQRQGLLKKAASGVPCLRRSGFAQAGRPFAVLTYCGYVSRAKMAVALLDGHF
ncbi:MAG: hypothetical protein OEY57_02710 [Nitrospirota bacterium]|nr:hypothetical protein [Nitrospirota bacterium]